jgi:hypothetical protein
MKAFSYVTIALGLLLPTITQASPVVSRVGTLKELAAKGIEITFLELDGGWKNKRNVVVKWTPQGVEAELLAELEKGGFELSIQVTLLQKGDDKSQGGIVYRSFHPVKKNGVATTFFEFTESAEFDVILTFGDVDNFGSYVSLNEFIKGLPERAPGGLVDPFTEPTAKPE